ncbi:MAG: type II secretion system protein [Synechococcales cyanobacterium C42_A2020_086]|nr:type II secretion system protein [Synechococcales cyanobacterium C42_A2020_086]
MVLNNGGAKISYRLGADRCGNRERNDRQSGNLQREAEIEHQHLGTLGKVCTVHQGFAMRYRSSCNRHSDYGLPARLALLSFTRTGTRTGFTLFEMLVVLLIISTLAAIVAPSWLGFYTNHQLIAAQNEVYQALRQAQAQALLSRQAWRVSFRERERSIEWAIHATAVLPASTDWQPLISEVLIAPDHTTLRQWHGFYSVEFNHRGHVTPPFGRLTLISHRGGVRKRCVFVSTLLGALRKAADRACE